MILCHPCLNSTFQLLFIGNIFKLINVYMKKIIVICLAVILTACGQVNISQKKVHFDLELQESDEYIVNSKYQVKLMVREEISNFKTLYIPVDIPHTRAEITDIQGNLDYDWGYSVKNGTYYIYINPKNTNHIEAGIELVRFEVKPTAIGFVEIGFVNGDLEVIGKNGDNYVDLHDHKEAVMKVVE